MQDVGYQSRHVVHVDKLDAVVQILPPMWQQAGKALAPVAHFRSPITASVGRAFESVDHVVFHAGSGKNMRTQHICAAAAQGWRALLNYPVGLHFVNRIGQGVSSERMLFRRRSGQV